MDFTSSEAQHANTTSSSTVPVLSQSPLQDDSTPSASTRTLRSSTRAKAAKDKGKQKEEETQPTRQTRTTVQVTKRPRELQGKGKTRQQDDPSVARTSKKTRDPTQQTGITINEPTCDTKGKKRAAPDPSSDDDTTLASSSSSKRPKPSGNTPYSLRSRADTSTAEMPKKNIRQSVAAKSKAAASTARSKPSPPSPGPSRLHEDDVDMVDTELIHEDPDDQMDEIIGEHLEGEDEEEPQHEGDADDHPCDEPPSLNAGGGGGSSGEPRGFAGLDEASAMAIFSDFRHLGSYMVSLSGRLKTMLNNIKPSADPTTRLLTLQELSELLSISTEDTLAGSFPIDSFVRALVQILGGTGRSVDDDGGDGEDHADDADEDAALAAAIALSGGSQYSGDENLEAQVLAARCLANLMEALPGIAQTVTYHGAIPALCSKLTEISYIDLAEQTLSTLEKISEEVPGHIVREGGLAALLTYLDFFSIAVQRTALQAAANCCRNVGSENFHMVIAVWPIIRNCLGYSDQRLVEFACLCVIRVIDSFRLSSENLEALVDAELIQAVNLLLLPAGGSPLVAPNTYSQLLRALATSARVSAKITVALLEAGVVDMLYQILTGVLPSTHGRDEQGDASGGQGLGGGLADMTVMQNLAHRPKDQVEEGLSLISELLPPLPKDGVFDHRAYSERAVTKLAKTKAKAERVAKREASLAQVNLLMGVPMLPSASTSNAPSEAPTPPTIDQDNEDATPSSSVKDPTADRISVLRSKPHVVGRFMQLMVPILIDVYAASVTTTIRMKTLNGILKAISFLEPEGVKQVLTFVPVASFASSILSSKDHPTLVIGALQLVELLLNKMPTEYKPAFRREGVFHEIEALAARQLTTAKLKEKEITDGSGSNDASPPPSAPVPPLPSSLPGYRKLSQLSLDPEDAVTLRSRVIRITFLNNKETDEADKVFSTLRKLVERVSVPSASEQELYSALCELAALFKSSRTSVSSFELLQSGVIDGLLGFATGKNRAVPMSRRQEIMIDAFAQRKFKRNGEAQSPFSTLIKKLQESLTRMESFEVVTVTHGMDDSKRNSSPSLLARQLRLRLVAAEGSDIPRNLSNIVVSIHAIATFQALHDYLRPRVSGMLIGSGSRLSGMLAALAATRPSATGNTPAFPPVPTLDPTPVAEGSTATPATTITRRRSQRLSAKNASSSSPPDESPTESYVPPISAGSEAGPSSETMDSTLSTTGETAPSDTVVNDEADYADFTDDEVDAEVFDDEIDGDNSIAEKTVNLAVADDGSKIEAQTPDGTRVGTPAGVSTSREPPATPTPRASSSSKNSYAAALRAKPQDWHLEFSMDDHVLPLDLTIYGAIHQHELRKKVAGSNSVPPHMLWQGVYSIKFKKVPGPAPPEGRGEGSESSRSRSPTPPLSSLPEDAPHAKIVRLLRVLNRLNTLEEERMGKIVSDSAFVNNKLTAKLTRQLEEPMIVASQCLPDWALDLPQHFPFLFPFATRYNFLQSTSFGYARLILKWQSQQSRSQESNSSRRDDGVGFLGRLQRQKVRISRKHILESAMKVFELYGSSSSILEVEYFEEVGTGLGPTLEFYSLVSKEFARKDLKVWRDEDATKPGGFVFHPRGLFPAPISPEDIANDGGQKKTHIIRVIGQFVAKALLDSRIIDMSFNKVFLRLALGEEVPLTIDYLKLVDVELAQSLDKLRAMAASKPEVDKLYKRIGDQVRVEDLALDFTLPGYDIELRPGGRDIAVTSENVEDYIHDVLDAIIGRGAKLQAEAFREGFSKVFPISDLLAFTLDELIMLFGNADEDWSMETLNEALKADHGFNVESRAIRDLIEYMASLDVTTRRSFLQFITGSPKLPIGGFRGLNPALTVVRKPSEAPLTADDYLPSVMTCVNYLKLPDYSSKEVMIERLRVAMKEGIGSFHLS